MSGPRRFRPRVLAGRILAGCVLAGLGLIAGCGTAINVANNVVSRSTLGSSTGLSGADTTDLQSGRIDLILHRYGTHPAADLSPAQVSLLCDVLLKYRDFGAASICLDRYAAIGGPGAGQSAPPMAIAGKRALIALSLGNAARAASLTEAGNDTGSRYVHALAEARQGHTATARAVADSFARQFEPKQVYYAASLYAAIGDNAAALRVLEDPQRRLLRDYGVTPNQTAFGSAALVPFRLDVFDEFSFGWFKDLSYAPPGNVYVEYLAAHAMLAVGRTEEARQRLQALLAYPGIDAYRDVNWLILFDLGRLAQTQGRTQDAIEALRRSVGVIESVRGSVSSDEGRIGFASDKQAVYALLVDLLIQTGDTQAGGAQAGGAQAGGPLAAFDYAERARGRALVDLLASRDDLVPRQMSAQTAESTLQRLRQAEGQEALAAADPRTVRNADSSGLRRQIGEQAPSLAPLISVSPVSLTAIRRSMAPDETAVAFFSTQSAWIAFVVSQSELRTVRLPLANANTTVLSFLHAVVSSRGGSDPADYLSGARALYDGLIRPVEPYIQGRRLVLVPYGVLHYLPFATLNDGTAFLIERYSFREVPSLSALTVAFTGQDPGSGSLVIGNPERLDAPPLPNAQHEAVEVGRILPAATVLLGNEATLSEFLTLASSRSYIHIASHGEFDARNPLQSRLLLTSDAGSNGDLLVGSLYALRLNARLVTLSACETAVSLVSDGDDLIGLVRGFVFAGAQNVVASLWEIDDQATESLMKSFYLSLTHGLAVPDALRQAQLETMKRYPQPFFWAAFMPTSFTLPQT